MYIQNQNIRMPTGGLTVLACNDCSSRKSDKEPGECGLQLVSIPYEPNANELLILSNRSILYDQNEFLRTGVSESFIKNQNLVLN